MTLAGFAALKEQIAQCQAIWTFMKTRDEEELRRIVEHLALHFQAELKVELSA